MRHVHGSRAGRRAGGLALGFLADHLFADPRRWHPVAGFGRLAQRAETALYRPTRRAGVIHTGLLLAAAILPAVAAERRLRGRPATFALAALTWACLGGRTLAREGRRLADALDAGTAENLDQARAILPGLCGRDPHALDAAGLARAALESVAENTSDAVVGPLLWGALAGLPGLAAFRAVNTLDAMVGYRNERYSRFGTPAARLDDAAGFLPARGTALLTTVLAPVLAGDPRAAWRCWHRDGGAHPSPNAGRVEAAFAGALRVRLGGPVRYPHGNEERPVLGETADPVPTTADLRRAVQLSLLVGAGAAILAGASAAILPGAGPAPAATDSR